MLVLPFESDPSFLILAIFIFYLALSLFSSGNDSKFRSEKDDGFVRVTFKTEKGEQPKDKESWHNRNLHPSKKNCTINIETFTLCIRFLSYMFIVYLAVKKLNTPEYRHYLKLWNQETKPKLENMKDLPRLNQVGFCFIVYLFKSVSPVK